MPIPPPRDHEAWCRKYPDKLLPPETLRNAVEQIMVLLRQWSDQFEGHASDGIRLAANLLEDHFM
jgi:hypothetical protein